jgi:hypothetical protein
VLEALLYGWTLYFNTIHDCRRCSVRYVLAAS